MIFRLIKRYKYIALAVVAVMIVIGAFLLFHGKNAKTDTSSATSYNQPTTSNYTSNTANKYAPQLMKVGQVYYDNNHLISYELVSVDANYVDPKLQNSDYCPEAQQQESQGSHIIQPVSCTITSKLLTWNFTNTSDKSVDVPGAYAMYYCVTSSLSSDQPMLSEGYDPGPGVNGSGYWITHTSYPDDPIKNLSPSNILTQTLVDTIYQPHETKIVKSELGHNCTAVGGTVVGGSYTGWQI